MPRMHETPLSAVHHPSPQPLGHYLGNSYSQFENGCVSSKQHEIHPFPYKQSRDWRNSVSGLFNKTDHHFESGKGTAVINMAVSWNPLKFIQSMPLWCKLKQAFQQSLHNSTITPGSVDPPPARKEKPTGPVLTQLWSLGEPLGFEPARIDCKNEGAEGLW